MWSSWAWVATQASTPPLSSSHAKSGSTEVDAGKVVAREHPAAVEQNSAPRGFDDRAVAPDLSQAAQEGDGNRCGHGERSA